MVFRRVVRALGVLALAPAAALAFETVDTLPFPSGGAFPAWPSEGVRPWTVFTYGGLMHDTNALRRSTNEQSDTVLRIGAGGRATGRLIGRQGYLLEGFGEYYDFDRFDQIDHFGYGLVGNYLYEITNDVNGAVGYERRRRHADLGEFRRDRRAMVTTERLFADGGYRFHPDWRIFGVVEHNGSERSGDAPADVQTDGASVSLTYVTPLGNTLGVEYRRKRGDQRFTDEITGVAFTDDFDERELSAVVVYALGTQLRVRARVGHTDRDYERVQERNFSGTTYRGSVEWLPTTKLRLTLDALRVPESTVDSTATHVLRQGATFAAAYAITYKLVFTARFLNERRQYQGDPAAVVLGIQRDDTVRTWGFGLGWEPVRHWQLGAGVDWGDRSSNLLGRDYEYTQYMLNLRWTF